MTMLALLLLAPQLSQPCTAVGVLMLLMLHAGDIETSKKDVIVDMCFGKTEISAKAKEKGPAGHEAATNVKFSFNSK